jgi:hypothetical protein
MSSAGRWQSILNGNNNGWRLLVVEKPLAIKIKLRLKAMFVT